MSAVAQLAPLAVAVPLMVAAILMPLSKHVPRWCSDGLAALTAAAVAVMCVILALHAAAGPIVYWMGGWLPRGELAVGIDFSVDPMSGGLAAFVALLVFSALVFTWKYFDSVGSLFHVLMLVFLASMCAFALTGDIFNMFVFFELMSVTAYALTAQKIEESHAIGGAINFAITNSVGAFCVLLGIGLLYGRTGVLNLAELGQVLAHHPPDGLVVVSFMLIVCGFFVKGSVVPFHFWLDDAHAVAPTPVCMLFSGIMVQLGLYAVARIYWTVYSGTLAPHEHALSALFIGVGIATALIGAMMSFSQTHLKRLLAFSTVSHSGIFVCALGLFSEAGVAAAAIFVIGHGLVKGALFACSGVLLNRFGSIDEKVLYEKGKKLRFLGVLYFLGAFALAGIGPFGISAAKALYDSAFKDVNLYAVAMVAALASCIDAAAVFRYGGSVFLGIGRPAEKTPTPHREETETKGHELGKTPWMMLAPPAFLLAIAVWLGVSGQFVRAVSGAAHFFVDRSAYANVVLHGNAIPVLPRHASPRTLEDVLVNIAVTVAAIVLALLALKRTGAPKAVAAFAKAMLEPPWLFLRKLHSGIFTDYVAYMMFGLAAYGLWLVAAIR